MADNYVIREKYTHVDVVDGQVMPVRGVVDWLRPNRTAKKRTTTAVVLSVVAVSQRNNLCR